MTEGGKILLEEASMIADGKSLWEIPMQEEMTTTVDGKSLLVLAIETTGGMTQDGTGMEPAQAMERTTTEDGGSLHYYQVMAEEGGKMLFIQDGKNLFIRTT